MRIEEIHGLRQFNSQGTWSFSNKFKKIGKLNTSEDSITLKVTASEDKAAKYFGDIDRITSSSGTTKIALYGSKGFPGYIGLDRMLGYHPAGKKNLPIFYSPMRVVIQRSSGGRLIPNKISNISASVPGINIWMGKDLLSFSLAERKFNNSDTVNMSFEIGHFAKVSLVVGVAYSESMFMNFTASHDNYVKINFFKPTSYSLAIWYIKAIEDFFNFIFCDFTNQFYFTSENGLNNRGLPITTEIIDVYRINKTEHNRKLYSLLFKMDEIKNPENLIKNWISAYTTTSMSRVWESIRFLQIDNSGDIKSKFLTLVGAIENIHRDFIEKPRTPDEKRKYKEWLNSVTANLSPEDTQKVKNGLRFRYEPTLDQRLKEVYDIVKHTGVPQMSTDMLNKIAPTRNKEIHSLKSSDNILNYNELIIVNNLLTAYLKVIILHVIGLDNLEISSIVSSSYLLRPRV